MEPIKQSSKEFHVLEKYAKDTHGATHQHYSVNVMDAFRVERYVACSPRTLLLMANQVA